MTRSKTKSADNQQNQQLEEQYKRALADYHNLQKRVEQERLALAHHLQADLISQFLPLYDDLLRAHHHLKDTGLQLVVDHFDKILTDLGVTTINPQDSTFDPQTMECLQQVPGPKDQVVTVEKPGFSLDQTLIRPAQVTVGTGQKS